MVTSNFVTNCFKIPYKLTILHGYIFGYINRRCNRCNHTHRGESQYENRKSVRSQHASKQTQLRRHD